MSFINQYLFLGLGELHIDRIYDSHNKILKENGGGSTSNVLYNLGLSGEEVYAIGVVGNDANATMALDSLNQGNVNTDYISNLNKKTNIYHIFVPEHITGDESVTFSPICPVTQQNTIERSIQLPSQLPEKFENKNIILVIGDLVKPILEFIKDAKLKCKKCKIALDIGSNRRFENLDKAYINEFLSYVDIIQLNQKCIPVLYKKLDISSNLDFFNMLNLDLLVVTKGRNGANFVYSDGNTTFEVSKFPQIVADMVDPTGAGDAFLSMILKSYQKYLIQEKQIDSKFIDKSFFVANSLSRKIVGKIGARTDFTIFKELIDELNAEQSTDAR